MADLLLLAPRRRRWRKTALQGLQGTQRYANASTRLTVKFRVEKVHECDQEALPRSAASFVAVAALSTNPGETTKHCAPLASAAPSSTLSKRQTKCCSRRQRQCQSQRGRHQCRDRSAKLFPRLLQLDLGKRRQLNRIDRDAYELETVSLAPLRHLSSSELWKATRRTSSSGEWNSGRG